MMQPQTHPDSVSPSDRRTRGLARYRPPHAQPGHLVRSRVTALLETAAATERVIVVVAPSGYGKTSAVREWVAGLTEPVAWLSLGPYDTDDVQISAGILRALSSVSPDFGVPPRRTGLLGESDSRGAARLFEQLSEVLVEPVTLIIDDAQRAGDALRDGLLGALIEAGPEQLRLVVVGTSVVEMELSRLVVGRPECVIRAAQLAFDIDEIAELAGVDHPRTPRAVFELTQGWPIAVRLLCLSRNAEISSGGSETAILRDYLRHHVLATLRPELQDFALDTAIGIDLTPKLAAAITGAQKPEALLEECAALGLFLDRVETPGGIVYRWHAVFIRQCRAILEASDPGRLRRAHRRAAEFLESDDPLSAIGQLLEAGEPRRALGVLLRHWVWLHVGGDPRLLDQVCTALPAPYHLDPRVLLIRACAEAVINARQSSVVLMEKAEKRVAEHGAPEGFEELRWAVQLLVSHDGADLRAACRGLYEWTTRSETIAPRERMAIFYLIGWTGLRMRIDPGFFMPVFFSAADEAEALGETEVARRVLGHLACFLCWASKMGEARSALDRAAAMDAGIESAPWRAYAGGSEEFAAGFVAFWDGEFGLAADAFTRVIRGDSTEDSFAGVARWALAFTATALGDPALRARAAREVQAIPVEDSRALLWRSYRESALAALYEGDGQRSRAARMAERVGQRPGAPMTTVLMADIIRRSGNPQGSLKMLAELKQVAQFGYVRVPLLLSAALLRRREGNDKETHRLCELALERAVDDRAAFAVQCRTRTAATAHRAPHLGDPLRRSGGGLPRAARVARPAEPTFGAGAGGVRTTPHHPHHPGDRRRPRGLDQHGQDPSARRLPKARSYLAPRRRPSVRLNARRPDGTHGTAGTSKGVDLSEQPGLRGGELGVGQYPGGMQVGELAEFGRQINGGCRRGRRVGRCRGRRRLVHRLVVGLLGCQLLLVLPVGRS